MGNVIGGMFAVVFLFYIIVCAGLVPAYFTAQWQANRECAQQHNVFRCERIEIWQPAVERGTGDE
jgi:glycopeptide antibiotics resistance protein